MIYELEDLNNEATSLRFEHRLLFGKEAEFVVNNAIEKFVPFRIYGHRQIGRSDVKLQTEEWESKFSSLYIKNEKIWVFFGEKDGVFELSDGSKFSELVSKCISMEYFITNEKFEYLVAVCWYTIEILYETSLKGISKKLV